MTDEIEVEEESEPTKTAEKQEKTKSDKVFTQEEVNRLIGRERTSLTTKHQTELELKDASLMKFEGIIKTEVDAKKADLPESIQKILSKLPLIEQYETLMEDGDLKVSKKLIPPTTKSEEKPKPDDELKASAYTRFKK